MLVGPDVPGFRKYSELVVKWCNGVPRWFIHDLQGGPGVFKTGFGEDCYSLVTRDHGPLPQPERYVSASGYRADDVECVNMRR
jgi:hypothetical protein